MCAKQILVVDDEGDIRAIAEISLRLGGWEPISAASGRQALDMAASAQPDVILLDVMMPELDGPKTLELLRADPRTSAIPVIFLTAKAQLSEQRLLHSLGAQGVISKPFDPMTLAKRVADLLEVSP